jgi:hypothetical protein
MSEVTYYQDENVTITNARAVFCGRTYAIANIISVAGFKEPAERSPGIALAVIGLVIAACSNGLGANGGIIFGVLLLIGGIALAAMAKPSYMVRIGSASGETDVLVSDNWRYVAKIVKAMNRAIINRG